MLVGSLPQHCLDSSLNHAIPISITNRGSGPVSFSLREAAGLPFKLHPWAFEIVPKQPVSEDPNSWGVLLEHYVPPNQEVWLGAGDSVELQAYASLWPLAGYTGTVRLQVRDTRGRLHYSEELSVCPAGSMPNDSSKPTPLRGAPSLKC